MKKLIATTAATLFLIVPPAMAELGIKNSAAEAIDPDCTPGKAAKGAAMKATVGVGNRCGVAETARDVTGTDGKLDDTKDSSVKKTIKKKAN